MFSRLLTMKDICEKYHISRATVDRWRKEGMPFSKVGRGVRFIESEVDDWIKINKNGLTDH